MTTYVDSSALVSKYLDEPASERATQLLSADAELITGRLTIVEVRRTIAQNLGPTDGTAARAAFATDLREFDLVEIDSTTCELAAVIGEQLGVRSLDALHLGAAQRVGKPLTFLTFDVRQGRAARELGFDVAGV